MVLNKRLISKLKFLLNFFIVIIQGVIVAALWVMIDSRNEFENISANIFLEANYIMNSYIIDFLMTPIIAWIALILFIPSVGKEFVIKNKNHKLIANLSFLFILLLIFSTISYGLYTPIKS